MHPEMAIKDLDIENMDTSLNWEYVMLDTLSFQTKKVQDEDQHQDIIEEVNLQKTNENDPELEQLQDVAQVLDMPPPWPPKIYIDKE